MVCKVGNGGGYVFLELWGVEGGSIVCQIYMAF